MRIDAPLDVTHRLQGWTHAGRARKERSGGGGSESRTGSTGSSTFWPRTSYSKPAFFYTAQHAGNILSRPVVATYTSPMSWEVRQKVAFRSMISMGRTAHCCGLWCCAHNCVSQLPLRLALLQRLLQPQLWLVLQSGLSCGMWYCRCDFIRSCAVS
jgi:hypothetical protein